MKTELDMLKELKDLKQRFHALPEDCFAKFNPEMCSIFDDDKFERMIKLYDASDVNLPPEIYSPEILLVELDRLISGEESGLGQSIHDLIATRSFVKHTISMYIVGMVIIGVLMYVYTAWIGLIAIPVTIKLAHIIYNHINEFNKRMIKFIDKDTE